MTTIDNAQDVLSFVVHADNNNRKLVTSEDITGLIGISQAEYERASRYLLDKKLITGLGGGVNSAPRLVRLTTAGRILIEEGKSLRDEYQTKSSGVTNNSFSIENHGGTFNQQIGDNNQQNITIGITSEDVASLVLALREAGAEDLAKEVEQATNNGKEPGKIGRALASIIPALTATKELGAVAAVIAGFF